MNHDEAKQILLLYRTGTADADDPDIAAALAQAKQDVELTAWLDAHVARQAVVCEKFRQITPPAGLEEQIISEHAAARRRSARRAPVLVLAAAVGMTLLATCAGWWLTWHRTSQQSELAQFRGRMVRTALSVYSMDLATNDMTQLRAFFAQRQAPADYALPPGLQNAQLVGGAVEKWRGTNVAMVCFRTGKPLRPGESSDLWLFVADSNSLQDVTASETSKMVKVNRLITAAWTAGGKIYLLGMEGTDVDLRGYL